MKLSLSIIAILLSSGIAALAQNTFPNNGNVGIGTTTPGQKLTVKGGGIGFDFNDSDKKLYSPMDGTLEWMTHNGAGEHGFAISHQGLKMVYLNTSGHSYLNGGNLGLGTEVPAAKLHIVDSPQDSGDGSLIIGNTNSPNLRMGANTGYSWIQSHFNSPLRINESGNNVVMNLIGGNVGIGTETPDQKLTVKGGIGFEFNASDKKLYSPMDGTLEWMTHNQAGEHGFAVSHQGTKVVYLNTSGNSYLNGGNVGIGTATPSDKLSVNGKIRAHEIKVETANWPDYVFAKDYQLTGLEALEKYIQANKHLPEMPSAKEVEQNGIALGDMVKLQQKKIEELTLHLIEQNRKIENLEKVIKKNNKL